MFSSTYSSGFTDGLNRLGPPTTAGQQADVNNADILDPILAGRSGTGTNLSFVKNGYIFGYAPTGTWGSIASYQVIADPTLRGSSGQRSFFSNEPLVIRSNALSTATVSDMPI